MQKLAGIVVEHAGALRFVPASVAQRILRKTVISTVPGTELAMTLVEGRVVSVLSLGSTRRELLVCDVEGEAVALAGLGIVASGFYAAHPDGVRVGLEIVPLLDVAAELRRIEQRLWAERIESEPR